ncbi:MAG: hypothetical protein OSA51_02385 [Octadecabacter sp.]|nr:hypothetical protein [Octadecabacter sp.]
MPLIVGAVVLIAQLSDLAAHNAAPQTAQKALISDNEWQKNVWRRKRPSAI